MLTFQNGMKNHGIYKIDDLRFYLSALDIREIYKLIYRPTEAFAFDSPLKVVENAWLTQYRDLESMIRSYNLILKRLSATWCGKTADRMHKELQAWIDGTVEVKDYVGEIYSAMINWCNLWQRVQREMVAPEYVSLALNSCDAIAYEKMRSTNIEALCAYCCNLSRIAQELEQKMPRLEVSAPEPDFYRARAHRRPGFW